ncbi:hypothetical protein SAMN04487818_101600 [Actinokineospora terrae]|uniref:Uncharacterized protein n=1 Tax=Actinokineospora terrae TaxID=155974 RepID=A0A1H9LIB1_9PSEU|nr:hypothetical protein SAMN04487818_101600 [Actinokineospora terrae]
MRWGRSPARPGSGRLSARFGRRLLLRPCVRLPLLGIRTSPLGRIASGRPWRTRPVASWRGRVVRRRGRSGLGSPRHSRVCTDRRRRVRLRRFGTRRTRLTGRWSRVRPRRFPLCGQQVRGRSSRLCGGISGSWWPCVRGGRRLWGIWPRGVRRVVVGCGTRRLGLGLGWSSTRDRWRGWSRGGCGRWRTRLVWFGPLGTRCRKGLMTRRVGLWRGRGSSLPGIRRPLGEWGSRRLGRSVGWGRRRGRRFGRVRRRSSVMPARLGTR